MIVESLAHHAQAVKRLPDVPISTPESVPLTPAYMQAADILLFHGEYVDCLVVSGDRQEWAWLLGAAWDGAGGEIVVRQWYEWERTVAMEQVRLPLDTAARLEGIVRACAARVQEVCR